MAITKVINDLIDLNATDATKSLKMPKGAAYSGTAQDGMVRNSSEAQSQGSLNVMQHFNGTDWKNYENLLSNPVNFNSDVLIVAGGGGTTTLCGSGGAGGGGVLSGTLPLSTSATYSIQVGAGGLGSTGPGYTTGFTNGSNTFIDSYISTGGGYSAGACCGSVFAPFPSAGNSGGSGGGGGGFVGNGSASTGGASNQSSISPLTGYGFAGGSHISTSPADYVGAGGGGAGAAGQAVDYSNNNGGNGGSGHISTIITNTMASANSVGEVDGSNVYYSGGGGGQGSSGGGVGGAGGGGNQLNNGTAATGGGGGGATCSGSNGNTGGSGVLIVKYPSAYACTLSSASGLTEIVDTTSISGFNVSIFKVTSEGTSGTGTIEFS